MENKNNLKLLTAQERLAELRTWQEQLEMDLAKTQAEVHQAALGVLESDSNQPLDKQAEKIVEYAQFNQANEPWFYATLNSIMRESMRRTPILSEALKGDLDLPEDQFELGKDENLKWALAYTYHGVFPEFPSAVSKAKEYLESGSQQREDSERIYGFQYHPRRASLVFRWLRENVDTLLHFSQLSYHERKKYLPEEQ